jgi:hypothetical protein
VPLSAADITAAFEALSDELGQHTEQAEIVVIGGAALVLLFRARETTKDVDACFVKPEASRIRTAVARVADRLGLPEDWMNDGAKGFLVGLTEGAVLYESTSLVVRAPSTAQLLAMKLAAWRDAIDRSDARLLLSQMAGTAAEVWALVEPLVPPPKLDKAWYAFQDLWDAVHAAP